MATKPVAYLPADPEGLRSIDIGAGEGRDAVFFADRGPDVAAVDVSPAGLEKARRLATERDVEIATVRADANEFEVPEPVEVVFSSGTVQFIWPAVRRRQFERFRRATNAGGLHAMFAFVDHPDIPPAPDTTGDQYLFDRDELRAYYAG